MGKEKEKEYQQITPESLKEFFEFVNMSDAEFYDRYIADLTLEEQERFFDMNPDFLKDQYLQNMLTLCIIKLL